MPIHAADLCKGPIEPSAEEEVGLLAQIRDAHQTQGDRVITTLFNLGRVLRFLGLTRAAFICYYALEKFEVVADADDPASLHWVKHWAKASRLHVVYGSQAITHREMRTAVSYPAFVAHAWELANMNFSLSDWQIRKMRFEKIYSTHFWNFHNLDQGTTQLPASGGGSTPVNAKWMGKLLNAIAAKWNLRSLLDVGCGDLTWLKLVRFKKAMMYVGVDLVGALVEKNRGIQLRSDTNLTATFIELDISLTVPPTSDLVLLKDILEHLRLEDIHAAFQHLRESCSQYVLLRGRCNASALGHRNSNQASGLYLLPGAGYRSLDFCKAPFWFPRPIAEFDFWDSSLDPFSLYDLNDAQFVARYPAKRDCNSSPTIVSANGHEGPKAESRALDFNPLVTVT